MSGDVAQPGIESSIRVGDCFALLVEFHFSHGQMREAYRLIEQMRERRIILNPYLEVEMVREIHRVLNIAMEPEAAGDDDEVRPRSSESCSCLQAGVE